MADLEGRPNPRELRSLKQESMEWVIWPPKIHADKTKSSLQFASRALRVTNCAHVNEILTDAALLKRQKKEIEELKAKLQGSHSEHSEEEILNLRNTLLQTELERERIAMELEEEKKAHAERKKRLQEQAKKIENLSSMVLYSNRDENRDQPKKGKRRDTWCFGNLSRETLGEVNLEYLGRVVFYTNGILYPDSVVGTDSHTTMIAGWGVGGIESEATMLGQGGNDFGIYDSERTVGHTGQKFFGEMQNMVQELKNLVF